MANPKISSLEGNPNDGKRVYKNPEFENKDYDMQMAKKDNLGIKQPQTMEALDVLGTVPSHSLMVTSYDIVEALSQPQEMMPSTEKYSGSPWNLIAKVQLFSRNSEVILELHNFYDELMHDYHQQFRRVKKSFMEIDVSDSLSDLDSVDGFDCPRPVNHDQYIHMQVRNLEWDVLVHAYAKSTAAKRQLLWADLASLSFSVNSP
ncbi:hypothetical protein ACH5RR_026216 [Cinchona calisaya]|uniref:Uncharacterized protein n=1 Tax=Cinchona calisaya TaxID=153742 RepID=A0ABD2Z321_9GENT